MELSAKKTKPMTNNTIGINTETKVNGQKLQTVTSFKYLGLVITDEGSKPEILSRIAQATAVLTMLKPVWNDGSISLSSKTRLMHFLVTFIFLYACESWTLKAELQRRIQAMETRCYCKILRISYSDHVTNKNVRAKIQQAIGPHEDLLTIIKRCKLQWYDNVWPSPRGQWSTEENGGNWLQNHLWCPNNLCGWGKDDDDNLSWGDICSSSSSTLYWSKPGIFVSPP